MLDCMKCIERHANINYYKFNLTDKDSVMRNLSGLRFDFIIDDASHILEEQVQSLKSLYAFLKNGGSYYIEDVQSFESCKSFEIEAKLLGCNVEIVDLRKIKNRYDDLICVFRKP